MKKLIISPQAGFGNRMRALCSAKLIGSIIGREVYHYWTKDSQRSHLDHVNAMKSIDPSYIFNIGIPLFDGKSVDLCLTEWLPGDSWYREQSTAQSALRCKSTQRLINTAQIVHSAEENILIECSQLLHVSFDIELWFVLMTEIYKKFFPLNTRFSDIMRSVPCFDCGMAVRRTDFSQYFPNSVVDLHVALDEIKKISGSKIIFSDDISFQAELRREAQCPLGIGDGMTKIDADLATFFTLSKCRRVIGTLGSSFSQQAAIYGGATYVPLSAGKTNEPSR